MLAVGGLAHFGDFSITSTVRSPGDQHDLQNNMWTYLKNEGKCGELPSRGVKVEFQTVSRPWAGWGEPKTAPAQPRTLPKATQTPRDPDFVDFLAQIPILTFSSTKFD